MLKGSDQERQSGFDRRVVWALRMVGVHLGVYINRPLTSKAHRITFTFIGDPEMVKGVLTDFIQDEFDGRNVRFFADSRDNRQCFATFDVGKGKRYE